MKIFHRFTLPPRIAKEMGLLFWPWLAVITLAFAPLCWRGLAYCIAAVRTPQTIWMSINGAPPRPVIVSFSDVWGEVGKFPSGLVGLIEVGFLLGSVLLGAITFGTEFQNRTLPLLLSQPSTRLRLWGEKMLVLAGLLLLAAAMFVSGMSDDLARAVEVMLPAAYTLLPLVCSAGFWTLFARSTIGGMAFSLAALAAVMMTVTFTVGKIWEGQPFMVQGLTPLAMSVTGLAYSALFLWLGWWKFSRLELNTPDGGESGLGAGVGKAVPTVALLRCGSGSPVANLARKELRLLLSLLAFALLFALFWLALAWLVTAVPSQRDGAEMLLQVGTVAYMALALTLAGCLPLCEERSLGLHLANLTLPVAVGTQWRIKLLVALAVGLAAGVALPVWLSEVTAPAIASPLASVLTSWENIRLGLALFGLFVLLGFWSATMVGRVAHAIMFVALMVGAGFLAVRLGIWSAGGETNDYFMFTRMRLASVPSFFRERSDGQPWLFTSPPAWFIHLVEWVAARWQLSAEGIGGLIRDRGSVSFSLWPVIGAAALAAGIQTWRAFRIPPSKSWRSLGWLVGAVALAAGLETVLLRAGVTAQASMEKTSLVVETQAAFNAIKRPPPPAVAARWVFTDVTLAELEATGKLSAQTKYWLRNAKMRFQAFRLNDVRYFAMVIFPGGDAQSFDLGREFLPP